MPEVRVGPLVFEYDESTRYVGVGDGQVLKGTFELDPLDWHHFVEATGGLETVEKEGS